MEDSELKGGAELFYNIQDTLYLFTIFILPFLGYIASLIYSPESGIKWYKGTKFVLLDIANSSYGLFFTLFIYLFAGMGIIYVSNYYLGDGVSISRGTRSSLDPLANIGRFWDCIILSALPLGFFLSWISQPLMLQYQNLIIPGSLTVVSSFLFLLFAIYMIKIHWIIMILFLPLCIWSIYMCAFYFLPSDNKDNKDNEDNKNDNKDDKKDDKKESKEVKEGKKDNQEVRQP